MSRIEWSENSLQDILQICNYISMDSPSNADAFLDRLMASVETQLSTSPLIGREIPEIKDAAFREILYGRYRIMYHIEGSHITITHIRHGAREF